MGAGQQRFRISATRTGGHQTEIRSHILTLDVDTYVGAGQRELIRERVKAGMAAAKAKGKRVGRRRISVAKQNRARRLRADGWPYRRIANELGVSPATVVNYVKSPLEEQSGA